MTRVNVQSLSQLKDVVQRQVPPAPFDLPDERPVQIGPISQGFLGEPSSPRRAPTRRPNSVVAADNALGDWA